jgi:hypothetical protein
MSVAGHLPLGFQMRRSLIIIVCVLTTVAAVVGGGMAYYKWKFPYGQSHCCIIQMSMALRMYAEDNGGKYPAGESSPETSLSLLYRSNYVEAHTLRGMTVPEDRVRRILEAGQLLGPESCGWHYVPNLTQADDPELALLWCKEPLGHNGERTKSGGRQIVLNRGDAVWISGSKWPVFLKLQEELLKHRSARAKAGLPLVTGTIELPDGRPLQQTNVHYTIREVSKEPHSSGSGSSSGILSCSELVWYHAPFQDGTVTRTLSFSNLVSDPVTITFSNGVPDITNFVFKMRSRE